VGRPRTRRTKIHFYGFLMQPVFGIYQKENDPMIGNTRHSKRLAQFEEYRVTD
jgi:hypothetical protein